MNVQEICQHLHLLLRKGLLKADSAAEKLLLQKLVNLEDDDVKKYSINRNLNLFFLL